MIYVTLGPREYILRIEKGEEIPEVILKFYQRFNFRSGIFYGIGACEETELAVYQPKIKKYRKKKLKKQMEITSLIGNLSLTGYEMGKAKHIIHAHITLSDQTFKAVGGHLIRAKINPTCEIYLKAFSQKLKKGFDPKTGLMLISGNKA